MLQNIFKVLVTLAVVALVAWPGSWDKGQDSFPLSPYPMFARKKTSAHLSMEYVLAFDAHGKRSFVAPRFIGSREVLQARALIHNAIASGNTKATLFCRKILTRLRSETPDITRLQMVRGNHDSVAYLQGDTQKSVEKVLVQCQ